MFRDGENECSERITQLYEIFFFSNFLSGFLKENLYILSDAVTETNHILTG